MNMTTPEESAPKFPKPLKAAGAWRAENRRFPGTNKPSQRIAIITTCLLAAAPSPQSQEPRAVPVRGTERTVPGTTAPLERGILPRTDEHFSVAKVEERIPTIRETSSAAVKSSDRIWAAVILASNNDKASPPPAELNCLTKSVQKYFGYKQVELVGTAAKAIGDSTEHWLVPSQEFWVNVKSVREPKGTYLLNIQIFHDERSFLGTRVRVGPNSPLLIRGPACSDGQLVIAIQVLP